jgi:hypothetical protein
LPIGLYIGHATMPASYAADRASEAESFFSLSYLSTSAAWRRRTEGGEWNAKQQCCWMPRPPARRAGDLDDEEGMPIAGK